MEKLEQRRFPQKKKAGGRATIKECAEVDGQFVEEAKKITTILAVGVSQSDPSDLKVNLEPLRFIAAPDGLDDDVPLFSHADSGEAVEHGEGLLSDEMFDCVGLHAIWIPGFGFEMAEAGAQAFGGGVLRLVQMLQVGQSGDLTGGRKPVEALELLRELLRD